MPLELPADLEVHADNYDQLTDPGVYVLLLNRPDNPAAAWDREYDARPEWFVTFRDAAQVAYVGAASDVLHRLEEHRDGEVRQAVLLRICAIDRLHTVFWFDDADRAFERESGLAMTLQQERPEWYVHSR